MGVQIGGVNIHGHTALAPLAGITDRSFRLLCRQQGASFAVTEMVSAQGLAEGSEKSSRYLDFEADEFPIAVQLFGSEPDVMAEGARVVAERNPDIIDINCGCPVKKIVTRNAGAALLKVPERLGQIIAAMVRAVEIPVTLKIRSGWAQADQAVAVARIAEDSGAAGIAVHGRTREAKFSGRADWDIIAEVKNAVSIPVIGNGDVRGPEAAQEIMRKTGCDLVMVGRWAIGNPWIFKRVEVFLQTGDLLPEPADEDRLDMAVHHLKASIAFKGLRYGVLEMRRHLSAYIKGVPAAARYRRALMTEDDPHHLTDLLCRIKAEVAA